MAHVTQILGEDFEGIRSSFVASSTSNLNGLTGFYRLGGTLSQSRYNYATNSEDASSYGSPTITPLHASLDSVNYIQFASTAATADRTVAIVVQGRNDAGATVFPCGVFHGSPTTTGAEYFEMTNTSILHEMTVFDPSTGLYATNLTTPSVTLRLNEYDMVVIRLTSELDASLFLPRSGSKVTASTSNSTGFPVANKFESGVITSAAQSNVSLFAHWSRALTDQEIADFYTEQKTLMTSHNL